VAKRGRMSVAAMTFGQSYVKNERWKERSDDDGSKENICSPGPVSSKSSQDTKTTSASAATHVSAQIAVHAPQSWASPSQHLIAGRPDSIVILGIIRQSFYVLGKNKPSPGRRKLGSRRAGKSIRDWRDKASSTLVSPD